MKSSEINIDKISSFNEEIDNIKKNQEFEERKCNSIAKLSVLGMTKEVKPKYGIPFSNKPVSYNRNPKHPLAKRKCVPAAANLTNASAKVVLFERNVQIKDLESKVRYLQSKIKELEGENKTLHDVQCRQERELKKFKEGIADIPSLLRSHKEETKVLESTVSSLRKELRDCQKELKAKNEVLLKKEYQIDKQNFSLKRIEILIQDNSAEIRDLKDTKLELEEENRKLLRINENLKFENGDLQKKIKEMAYQILKLEENLSEERDLNKQLKDELDILQKKHDDILFKVSCGEEALISDEPTNSSHPKEKLSKSLNPVSSEVCLESDSKDPEKSQVAQESKEKYSEKEKTVDKTKEALIHTLKLYQEMYNTESNCSTGKSSAGVAVNHIKSLPPLKQTFKRYSQSLNSTLINKEPLPSLFEANLKTKSRYKSFGQNELTKDFHSKLKVHDDEIAENVGIFTLREFRKIDKYSSLKNSDESLKSSSMS